MESQQVEYKKSFGKEAIISLVAFANIERYGTGFVRIREYLRDYPEVGLDIQEKGDFFWAEVRLINDSSAQVTPEVTPEVYRMLKILDGKMSRIEIMKALNLKDEKHFRENYQQLAISMGLIEMTIPGKPKSSKQKYCITETGKAVLDRCDDDKPIL